MLSYEAVTLLKPLVKTVIDDFHLLFQFYYICGTCTVRFLWT